jgi:hypothetical protein
MAGDRDQVGGYVARIKASPYSFTRPSDIVSYSLGDLMANDTVAANVVPLHFSLARNPWFGGMIRRGFIRKTGVNIVNALFRLHLFAAIPTVVNGDNGVFTPSQSDKYAGALDFSVDRAFSDGAAGYGVPVVGSELIFTSDEYWGLMEARGSYPPVSAEQFSIALEVMQN